MPKEAQRLQHGSVRVLKDLTGMQIVGSLSSFFFVCILFAFCCAGRVHYLDAPQTKRSRGLWKGFDNIEGFFQSLGGSQPQNAPCQSTLQSEHWKLPQLRNVQDAIAFCKHMCYSDFRCQYWTYAPNYGCWIEDASQADVSPSAFLELREDRHLKYLTCPFL